MFFYGVLMNGQEGATEPCPQKEKGLTELTVSP